VLGPWFVYRAWKRKGQKDVVGRVADLLARELNDEKIRRAARDVLRELEQREPEEGVKS
jgi:trimethylamine:corrinoid methyltransferase-like protein